MNWFNEYLENYDEIYYTGKTKWSNEPIKSNVGSLDNYYHRPGGGDKDIREIRYHFQAPNSISSQVNTIFCTGTLVFKGAFRTHLRKTIYPRVNHCNFS